MKPIPDSGKESSLIRGFRVIEYLSNHLDKKFSQIKSEALGDLNPVSTTKILKELIQIGVIKKNEQNHYQLTNFLKNYTVGRSIEVSLAETLKPRMKIISSDLGVSCIYFIRNQHYLTCLLRTLAPYSPSLIEEGVSRPLDVTASGSLFFDETLLNMTQDVFVKNVTGSSSDMNIKKNSFKKIKDTYLKENIYDDYGIFFIGARRIAKGVYYSNKLIGVLSLAATKEHFLKEGFRETLINRLNLEIDRLKEEL